MTEGGVIIEVGIEAGSILLHNLRIPFEKNVFQRRTRRSPTPIVVLHMGVGGVASVRRASLHSVLEMEPNQGVIEGGYGWFS